MTNFKSGADFLAETIGKPIVPLNIIIDFAITDFSTYRHLKSKLVDEFERQFCQHVVGQYPNITIAARTLRMDRKHLSDLIKKHGIKR